MITALFRDTRGVASVGTVSNVVNSPLAASTRKAVIVLERRSLA